MKYRRNTENALDVVKLCTSQCLGLCMWNKHQYELAWGKSWKAIRHGIPYPKQESKVYVLLMASQLNLAAIMGITFHCDGSSLSWCFKFPLRLGNTCKMCSTLQSCWNIEPLNAKYGLFFRVSKEYVMSYLLERFISRELETRAKNNHDFTDANVLLIWTNLMRIRIHVVICLNTNK